MNSYPNQYVLIADKPTSKGNFATFDFNLAMEARKKLSNPGFDLYIYLLRIGDKKEWALSRAHYLQERGCSGRTYERALQDLKENSFIVLENGKWIFRP